MVFYLKIKQKNKQLNDSNLALENLATQKNVLLKEVHHRVKNNLTTLKSLLFLQAKSANNDEVKLILNECQMRIQSMALIHQNLYEESENESLDFKHFVLQLFTELELAFKPEAVKVKIEINIDHVFLDMQLALYLGLVLNELVTNSYKYAFNNLGVGTIGLNIIKNEKNIVVTYYDSGHGLLKDFNEINEGFGFKLIRILTQQINGTLVYENKNQSSKYIITFNE